MTERLVSTQATSGAGTIFEHRVAAIMIGRLLRGAHVPFGVAQPLAHAGLRFRRRISPTPALIQKRIGRLKPNPNRFLVNHESFLYPSSRKGNPSPKIFRFVYFPTGP